MTNYKQAFEVESRKTAAQQRVIGDLKEKLSRAREALEYYADGDLVDLYRLRGSGDVAKAAGLNDE